MRCNATSQTLVGRDFALHRKSISAERYRRGGLPRNTGLRAMSPEEANAFTRCLSSNTVFAKLSTWGIQRPASGGGRSLSL